jgi:hypothetical protein
MKNLKQKIIASLVAIMMLVTNTIVPVYAAEGNLKWKYYDYNIKNEDLNGDLAPDGSVYHYAYDLEPEKYQYDNKDDFAEYRIDYLEEGYIDSSFYSQDIYPEGYYKIYNPNTINEKYFMKEDESYLKNDLTTDMGELVKNENLNDIDNFEFDGKMYNITFDLKNVKNGLNEPSLFILKNVTTGEEKIFKTTDGKFDASEYKENIKYDEGFNTSEQKKNILEKIKNNEPIDLEEVDKTDRLIFEFDHKRNSEYELKEVRTFQNRHRELMPTKTFTIDNILHILNEKKYLPSYTSKPAYGYKNDTNDRFILYTHERFIHPFENDLKYSTNLSTSLMRPVPSMSYSDLGISEFGDGAKDFLSDYTIYHPTHMGLVIVGYKDRVNTPKFNISKRTSDNKEIKTAWKIINNRTNEWHIIVTDEKGQYSSPLKLPQTEEEKRMVNRFDYLNDEDLINLDNLDNKVYIDFKDFKEDDTYTLEELKSTSNKEYDLKKYNLDENGNLTEIGKKKIENRQAEKISNKDIRTDLYNSMYNYITYKNTEYDPFNSLISDLNKNILLDEWNPQHIASLIYDSSIGSSTLFGYYDLEKNKITNKYFLYENTIKPNNQIVNLPNRDDYNFMIVESKVINYNDDEDIMSHYTYKYVFYDITNLSEEEEKEFNKSIDTFIDKKEPNQLIIKVPYRSVPENNTYKPIDYDLYNKRIKNLNKDNFDSVIAYNSLDFTNDNHLLYLIKNMKEINNKISEYEISEEEFAKDLMYQYNNSSGENKTVIRNFVKKYVTNYMSKEKPNIDVLKEIMIPVIETSYEKLSISDKTQIKDFVDNLKNIEKKGNWYDNAEKETLISKYKAALDNLSSDGKSIIKNDLDEYIKNNLEHVYTICLKNQVYQNIILFDNEKDDTSDLAENIKKIFDNIYINNPVYKEEQNWYFDKNIIEQEYNNENLAKILYKDYIDNATDEELNISPIPIFRYLILNTKTFEGEYTLEFLKILKNKDLEDGEFSFDLIDKDGNIETVKNNKDGNIKFSPIKLRKEDIGKTLEYTIKENQENKKSYINYDNTVYKLQIKVEEEKLKNGDRNIVGRPSLYYDNGEKASLAAFSNTYNSKGTYTPKARKVLDGKELQKEEFSFQLKDKDGKVIQTKTNDKDGNIVFDSIEYTQDDIANSPFVYTVEEIKGNDANIDYDTNEYTITVDLKDNKDGAITPTETIELDGNNVESIEFKNTYNPPKEEEFGKIKVKKEVESKYFNKDQNFNFELYLDGKLYKEFTLKANQTKEFDNIPLGSTYELREVKLEKGFELLTKEEELKGKVENTETINLVAVNKYNPPKEEEKFGKIKVIKELQDGDKDKEFDFTIKIGEKVKTIKVSANKPYISEDIKVGTPYEVRELTDNLDKDYEFVSITDNHKGTIKNEDTIEIKAVNKYNPPKEETPVGKVGSIKVKKVVKGIANKDQEFKFVITINGKEEEFTLKANEEKVFNNIPLNTEYEVKEIDLPNNYKLENITNNKGKIISEEEIEVIATNIYETLKKGGSPIKEDNSPKKEDTSIVENKEVKRDVKTGVEPLKVVVGLLILAVLGFVGYNIYNKKQNN